MTKDIATWEIANAFGVSYDTVKSWEIRLPEDFGPVRVFREVSYAKYAASLEEDAKRRSDQGDSSATPGKWGAPYGEGAVRKAVEDYKAAKRARVGQKTPRPHT